MIRGLLGLLALGGTPVFGTGLLLYGYRVMAELALAPLFIVGMWVLFMLILGMWLNRHPSPALRAGGEAFEKGSLYTALFQGVIYTVFVLWPIALWFGFGELPDTRTQFLLEFGIGAGYLSAFLYGATGLTGAVGASSPRGRWIAILYALVTVAVPVAVLIRFEAPLRALARENALQFSLTTMGYLFVLGLIGMWLVVGGAEDADAPPRRHSRLPG